MKRLFITCGLFTVVAAVAFILTIHDFLTITQRVPADILVVEGWAYNSPAIAEAAEEFRRGGYRVLITVGPPATVGGRVSERVSSALLAADQLQRRGIEKQSIVALPVPDAAQHRTYSSALLVKKWLKRSGESAQGINVFTIGPHARKSLVLFTRALGPAYPIGVISGTDSDYDPNRWWMSARGLYVMARKVVGYVYAITWPLPDEIPMDISLA